MCRRERMDPMSFENGLQPQLDLSGNAKSSPFFSKLPGELRNITYAMIFAQPQFGKDGRRRLLSPSALRTCRQFYTEAVKYLYAFTEHKITIEPDLAIFRAAPRIPSQFISTRNIGMIRRLELELRLPMDQFGTISIDDVTLAERHLRGICLHLSSNGAVLESLKVVVYNGFMLRPQGDFELLDGLREIRVNGRVQLLGMEECQKRETHELVKSIRDYMIAPDVVDGDGRSQVTIAAMCQDLWDYLNLCYEHVEDWPADSASDYEKGEALEELRRAFEVECVDRPEIHFPEESNPMEMFRAALWSIEAIYAKIDRERFGEYHEAATRARERLYIRKAFREMVPHGVPDIFAFD